MKPKFRPPAPAQAGYRPRPFSKAGQILADLKMLPPGGVLTCDFIKQTHGVPRAQLAGYMQASVRAGVTKAVYRDGVVLGYTLAADCRLAPDRLSPPPKDFSVSYDPMTGRLSLSGALHVAGSTHLSHAQAVQAMSVLFSAMMTTGGTRAPADTDATTEAPAV